MHVCVWGGRFQIKFNLYEQDGSNQIFPECSTRIISNQIKFFLRYKGIQIFGQIYFASSNFSNQIKSNYFIWSNASNFFEIWILLKQKTSNQMYIFGICRIQHSNFFQIFFQHLFELSNRLKYIWFDLMLI